jgi:ABC-type sugar transport system, periplasmic component
MLVTLLTACGQKNDSNSTQQTQAGATTQQAAQTTEKKDDAKPVTIKAMFWAQETKDQFAKLSEDYSAKYPNVKVEWEYPPNSDYKKILSTRILSGEAPDIFGAIDSSFFKYCRPMEDQAWRSRTLSSSNLSMKGQLMGIPLTYAALVVYYNKTVFANAGVTEMPKTWDEFLVLCEKFKAAKITPIAFGMKDSFVHNVVIAQCEQAFAAAIPDNFFEQLYFGKDKIANHPEFLKGMEKYLELYKKGYFPEGSIGLDYNSVFTMLANGKAAMCIHGSWLPGFVWGINKDTDLGAFAFPDGDTTSSIAAVNDWNLACSKDTKIEKDVLQFIDFVAQKDNLKYLSEAWQQLPTFNDVEANLKPVMVETMNIVKQYKNTPCFYVDVPDPNYELCKLSQEMFLGKKTPQQAVDAFDQVCQQYKDSKKALY